MLQYCIPFGCTEFLTAFEGLASLLPAPEQHTKLACPEITTAATP